MQSEIDSFRVINLLKQYIIKLEIKNNKIKAKNDKIRAKNVKLMARIIKLKDKQLQNKLIKKLLSIS